MFEFPLPLMRSGITIATQAKHSSHKPAKTQSGGIPAFVRNSSPHYQATMLNPLLANPLFLHSTVSATCCKTVHSCMVGFYHILAMAGYPSMAGIDLAIYIRDL